VDRPRGLTWYAAAGLLSIAAPALKAQHPGATVRLSVRSDRGALPGSLARSGRLTARTDSTGRATLQLAAGATQLTVTKFGFTPDTLALQLSTGTDTSIVVELQPTAQLVAPVIVTSTRADRRIEDEPLRVEVLGGDDISEKNEMRPADLSSLLDELSGVRMHTTSASLGATNIRLEGLPGRYTLVLNDGLPLFGTVASGFGLVEQPPLDLRQAEVIKGAASALYGPAALGGVVDLVSRRPPDTSQALVNGTSQGGADLLVFDARSLTPHLGLTVLGGLHRQPTVDPDHDGWTDVPGLRRVEVRPRIFYDDSAGRSFMITAGALSETRTGGALFGRTGLPGFLGRDSLATRHVDVGATGKLRISDGFSLALRTSANLQDRRRMVNGAAEREREGTTFGELSGTTVWQRQVLIVGAAWQRDQYSNRTGPWADQTTSTPGLFVQHTYAPASWIASTLDGRCDASSVFGTICTPRASLLFRPTAVLNVRASVGGGWSAPSALNDQTEAIGLAHVREPVPLEAERARSASLDVTASHGPLQVSGTLFADAVRHPVGLRPVPGDTSGLVDLVNAAGDLRTHGGELFAVYNQDPFVVTAYYAATRSREISPATGRPREAPYVPREEAGLDAALEDDDSGTYLATEIFYTGRQALQDDPYRAVSAPYTTLGILAAQRFGRVTVFVNAENLTGVRQTSFEPLMRTTVGDGGQWSVEPWGPLDGRRFNAGVRCDF